MVFFLEVEFYFLLGLMNLANAVKFLSFYYGFTISRDTSFLSASKSVCVSGVRKIVYCGYFDLFEYLCLFVCSLLMFVFFGIPSQIEIV